MTLRELKEMNKAKIVEVNGIQLGFQVSMLSRRKRNAKKEKYLLESYYKFLDQSKENGFETQYIEMTVGRALCIFEDIDGMSTRCIREVQSIR